MWQAASKLCRLRLLGRTRNSQGTQYHDTISRGLAIRTDFAELYPAYVEANGGIAWVPTKLKKEENNEAKREVWSKIHKLAESYVNNTATIRYRRRTSSSWRQWALLGR